MPTVPIDKLKQQAQEVPGQVPAPEGNVNNMDNDERDTAPLIALQQQEPSLVERLPPLFRRIHTYREFERNRRRAEARDGEVTEV